MLPEPIRAQPAGRLPGPLLLSATLPVGAVGAVMVPVPPIPTVTVHATGLPAVTLVGVQLRLVLVGW